MNHEHIHALSVFADHLSFTRAAEQLHISQPALHVQIKKLERAVGRPLYRREGKTLRLTPEGSRLAAFGRETQERERSVLEEVQGRSHSGPVVLASGQGAFLYLLGPAIRAFPKDKWPLRLVAMTGPEAVAAVREARAHLGVTVVENPPPDLAAMPLLSFGQKVVLPASHRLAKRRQLLPAELDGEELVVAPAGSPHRTMVTHTLRASGCRWRVAVEATGWELMLHFAKHGVGIAVVNDFCPTPRGMVGVALEGAPRVAYSLISRVGFINPGTDVLRELILRSLRARQQVAEGAIAAGSGRRRDSG